LSAAQRCSKLSEVLGTSGAGFIEIGENMLATNLWNRFNKIIRIQQKRVLHSIYSAEEFRQILRRERARTDRSSREFSLVVFDIGSSFNSDAVDVVAQCLVHVLEPRVRTTDEVGWCDERRIGIVLPDTPAQGAWKLVKGVCKAISANARPSCYTVYTYPSSWMIGSDDDAPQARVVNPLPALDHNMSETASKSECSPACKPALSAVQPKTSRAQANARSVESVEQFFAHSMPLWKRIVDIVGSLFGLVLFFPLFLLIGIMIKIVSPGPVFFKQLRAGYMGKLFTCWKFRTMRLYTDTSTHKRYLKELIHAEKPMTKLDVGDDVRIIPLGKLLRQLGLDELPQLINVIRGEMSLIGPRPCIPYEAREYLPWQRKRFDTMPGLTGLWQVSGKNRTTFNEMMRLDITYVKQRSFWLDVKIFLKTFPAIISQFIN
jgi:lipopolysaccharide/colanic/teichoic acid biosynthesis glycosyltransferase